MIYTKEIEDFLRENYPIHGGVYCADKLGPGFTAPNINNFCTRKKIRRNKHSGGQKFDIEKFRKVDSEAMAYFLGLLWADGHITKTGYQVILGIVKTDGLEFLKIIEHLGYLSHWEAKRNSGNRQDVLYIAINNKEINAYLRELEYDKKSIVGPTKVLLTIPEKFHRYFWLGFFDGDGGLVTGISKSLNFTGAFDQDWTELISFLNSYGVSALKVQIKNKEGDYSRISISSKYDMIKICQILYKDFEKNSIGLRRKYLKFLELKERPAGWGESGYIGVYVNKGKRRTTYRVMLSGNGVRYSKGGFTDIVEAAIYYDQEVIKLRGNKSDTNFPKENYKDLLESGPQKPIKNTYFFADYRTTKLSEVV